MRIKRKISGSVLPTVIVVSVLILTGLLGLLTLWEQQSLVYARSSRLRQARADVESAYTLYGLHPGLCELTACDGFRLYDSLPSSRVRLEVRAWGLYEAVRATTSNSLLRTCRILGLEPDSARTLFYAENRSALTLAGNTVLKGMLRLPQNGLVYGRVNADFFRGEEVPRSAVGRSEGPLPRPDTAVVKRIAGLFAGAESVLPSDLPDSLGRSFRDSTLLLRVGDVWVGECSLRGNIVLYADELRIDASCCMRHLLVCARKVIVGEGARIAVQIFARDTVILEQGAVLEYPSGVYAQAYAEIGDGAQVNGYVVVRDTVHREKITANYRQARTARVRGVQWVDGAAQVQGIVSGNMYLRQAVYFSPQGYYKDMLYDATLLANPLTAQPLWLSSDMRRKEAVCVD